MNLTKSITLNISARRRFYREVWELQNSYHENRDFEFKTTTQGIISKASQGIGHPTGRVVTRLYKKLKT